MVSDKGGGMPSLLDGVADDEVAEDIITGVDEDDRGFILGSFAKSTDGNQSNGKVHSEDCALMQLESDSKLCILMAHLAAETPFLGETLKEGLSWTSLSIASALAWMQRYRKMFQDGGLHLIARG